MSYHYIKKHYGNDNYFPDSSWKRMERYNQANRDTLIFNFGNCGYGPGYYSTGCGGGSFWGGFGAGLGHGLANFACGILSGLMGSFMGGSIFGMSTFGMPMSFNNYGMIPDYVGLSGFNNFTQKSGKEKDDNETHEA